MAKRKRKEDALRVVQGDGETRPVIVITTRQYAVNNAAMEHLTAHPSVFHRLGRLVECTRAGLSTRGIDRTDPPLRIGELSRGKLRHILTEVAEWREWKDDELEGRDVPDWSLSAIFDWNDWHGRLRAIEAVYDTPVLRPDGTVIEKSGYDEQTWTYLEPSGVFPPINPNPTHADARAACDCILDVVSDFEFPIDDPTRTRNHLAAFLAAVCTPFARLAFPGDAPMFLIDKNAPGTGGSLLSDIIGVIVSGASMARLGHTSDDEEMRKRLTALFIAGDRTVLLDNIRGRLDSPSLARALTSQGRWSDRQLGASKMIEVAADAVFYANGNNVDFDKDMERRMVLIRLETSHPDPERRDGFKRHPILAWVHSERERLVAAALTILRAFVVAGRPRLGKPLLGSFEGWDGLVGRAIAWAYGNDPLATRSELGERSNPETTAHIALMHGWRAAAGRTYCSVPEMLRRVSSPSKDAEDPYGPMRAAIEELTNTPPGKPFSARSVGRMMGYFRGRIADGMRIERSARDSKYGAQWRVVDVDGSDRTEGSREPETTPQVDEREPGSDDW